MGDRGPQGTTLISIASRIVSWIDVHGVRPTTKQCDATSSDLPHHKTIYRFLGYAGSFGAMVHEAQRIVQHSRETGVLFSSSMSHAISFVSCYTSIKTRTCLGYIREGVDCGAKFPDEGPHIRLCERCRMRRKDKRLAPDPVDIYGPGVTRVELRRWGVSIDGGIEESINWHGGR